MDGQGNLERTRNVREKSGKLKNKYLWQADFRIFIYSVQEGKRCIPSDEIVLAHLSLIGGYS